MTESEAIKDIKENILPSAGGKSLILAISALEKQIANKPHKNFEKFSGVWCSCGNYLGKGYFVEKPSFCSDCGQKLDWGDEE